MCTGNFFSAPSIPVGNGDVAEFTCISRDNLMSHVKTKQWLYSQNSCLSFPQIFSLLSSAISRVVAKQWHFKKASIMN